MKEWFMAHSRHERYLMVSLGALVIIVIVWFALLTPLNALTDKLQRSNKQALQSLVWMKEESFSRGVIPGINHNKPIDAVIKDSAIKHAVVIDDISLEDKMAHLKIREMKLNDFLNWLVALKNAAGITASQLEFSSSATQEGYIQITTLTLVRK